MEGEREGKWKNAMGISLMPGINWSGMPIEGMLSSWAVYFILQIVCEQSSISVVKSCESAS